MSALLTRTSTRRVLRLMASSPSYRVRSTCPPGTRIAAVRQKGGSSSSSSSSGGGSVERRWFHEARSLFAQKDAQHKDSLKPRSTEYSQSDGGDDAAATAGAFDGSTSSPEEGAKKVAKESGEVEDGDPMKASPGNPKMSKQKTEEHSATAKAPGSAGEASNRERTSSKQSPGKNGGGTSG